MVSKFACVTAGVFHLMDAAFFVPQSPGQCSSAFKLGSLFFLLATLLLLGHSQVIPRRFMQRTPGIFSFVEVMVTILVTEWLMNVLWCGMERFLHFMARLVCQNCLWCEYIVDTVSTLLMGLSALYVVCEVVCPVKMKTAVERVAGRALDRLPFNRDGGSIVDRIKDLRTYVKGAIYFARLTREQRMLSIQVFEVQVGHGLRALMEQSQELHRELSADSESQEESEEMQRHRELYQSLQEPLQQTIVETTSEFVLEESSPSEFSNFYPPLSEDDIPFDL